MRVGGQRVGTGTAPPGAFSLYTCEELTEGVRRLSVAVREEYEGSECTADPPPSVAGLPC